MNHNTLENYYKTIFALTSQKNYLISDLEALISYELDIYTSLLKDEYARQAAQLERARQEQEAYSRRRF